MYGSAVAVGAIGRGFLQVDRVERLQQCPMANDISASIVKGPIIRPSIPIMTG